MGQSNIEMHMYCLLCQTRKSEQTARLVETLSESSDRLRCISPKIVQRCWVKGRDEHHVHNYLPGYLFVYAEEPITDFSLIWRTPGVIRLLGQRENGFELTGDDLAFARMLYQMDGTLGIMKTIEVGDRVQLDTSLYAGFTGEVIKLDRRKGRAQIRFIFDGAEHKVWVGYDLVKTTDKSDGSCETYETYGSEKPKEQNEQSE